MAKALRRAQCLHSMGVMPTHMPALAKKTCLPNPPPPLFASIRRKRSSHNGCGAVLLQRAIFLTVGWVVLLNKGWAGIIFLFPRKRASLAYLECTTVGHIAKHLKKMYN